MNRPRGEAPWKDSAERAALVSVYREVDELLSGITCDASTDCCRVGRSGREPYPTAAEAKEIAYALRRKGLAPGQTPRNRLPLVDDPCPLLDDAGRCTIYESRPFGCRSFYCEGALSGRKLPRVEIQALTRRIDELSQRVAPRDPRARPLRRWLEDKTF